MEESSVNSDKKALAFKAFVTGYSKQKFLFARFEEIMTAKFPSITTLTSPNKREFWSGFAFLTFKNEEIYRQLLKEKKIKVEELEMTLIFNEHKQGQELDHFLENVKKRKIKVDKIPLTWDDKKLEEYFEQFSPVETAFVFKKVRKKQKFHQGMVTFFNIEDAVNIEELEKFEVPGEKRVMKVKRVINLKKKQKGSLAQEKEGQRKQRIKGNPRAGEHQSFYVRRSSIRGDIRLQKFYYRFKKDELLENEHQIKPTSRAYFCSRPAYMKAIG